MTERSFAAPSRVIYRIGMHTIPDSFCAATKIITNKASVHIQERLWRRDFCDGAKVRHAKERVIYRIGVHTLPDSFCAATKIITNKAFYSNTRTVVAARFL